MFAQAQFTQQQKQNMWDNAFALHQLGYTTPEIANILGIPQSTGGGDEGGVWFDPSKPWLALGMTEEKYKALYGDGGLSPTGNGLTDDDIKVMDYVEGLLTGGTDRRNSAVSIINNSKQLTAEQKPYALELLGQYLINGG